MLIGALALLAIAACGDESSSGSTSPKTTTAAPKEKPANLPDLVGKGLQSAQDTAQAAGFFNLTSHDSLGRGRNQVLDRDWKVCFQTPPAGRRAIKSRIDLGAVKLDENCPTKDAPRPTESGAAMPGLTGKSVKAARLSLDPSASVEVKDASGEDRAILVESNWKVCDQNPKAGVKLTG
jgi:hypothetical protein